SPGPWRRGRRSGEGPRCGGHRRGRAGGGRGQGLAATAPFGDVRERDCGGRRLMGARHKIKLPSLGETVESVVVVEWHVSEGEEVKADAPLLTVETDKVDTEVPAPIAGKVSEILVPAGAELAVGDPVCIIEE